MTASEQRVALAKWMGWRPIGDPIPSMTMPYDEPIQWWSKDGEEDTTRLPDFLNDLNAVHQAEKVLQDKCKYWPDYIDELSKLFQIGIPGHQATNWSQMVHASAAQRCEALLRCLGLWKDETPPQPAP